MLPPRTNKRRRGRKTDESRGKVVIIGGGIAGVSCAQEIVRQGDGELEVVLISNTEALKEVKSLLKVTEHLEELSVFERTSSAFAFDNPGLTLIVGHVVQIDTAQKLIHLQNNVHHSYDAVCICAGARPKLIADHPNILGIRDLESVQDLAKRLNTARRIALVGNGGIALELAYTLSSCAIDWLIKEDYIGNTFFDASASKFVMDALHKRVSGRAPGSAGVTSSASPMTLKTSDRSVELGAVLDGGSRGAQTAAPRGWALGPDWVNKTGLLPPQGDFYPNNVKIYYDTGVVRVETGPKDTLKPFPVVLHTSKGEEVNCDFVISATGVEVELPFVGCDIAREEDGSILVDESLRTSVQGVYAAGDCACRADAKHWFQMRLWNQARNMGIAAAHTIFFDLKHADLTTSQSEKEELCTNYEIHKGGIFEIFTHITHFFGYKVVLLGRFNGQGLGQDLESITKTMIVNESLSHSNNEADGAGNGEIKSKRQGFIVGAREGEDAAVQQPLEIWTRITPDVEYIKVTVSEGKVVGAMLVGDTDLEETFENLILNELDVSRFGIGLLDPEVDIEDYFD